MNKKIKILGIVSIIVGSITALLCILPIARGLFIALPLGFTGMVCSGIYVFIDTKNQIGSKKFTPGIIGMLLSSAPVLLIIAFTIINYFKH